MPAQDSYDIESDLIAKTKSGQRLPSSVPVESDVAWIGSLYWKGQPFNEQTQFGPVAMPASPHPPRRICEDPEKFPPATLKLTGKFLPLDRGNDVIDPDYTRSKLRAEDYARRFAQFGVFVIADPDGKATRAECEAALEKLEVTYRNWIELNDDMWAKTGRVKDGFQMGRIALEHFGLSRDWADRQAKMAVCQFCQKSVKPNTFRCEHCTGILDWSLAYKAGVVTKEQAEEHGVEFPHRGPGRPPKVKEGEF